MTHLLPWSGKAGNSWRKTERLCWELENIFAPRPTEFLNHCAIRGVTNCLPRCQVKLKVEGTLFKVYLRIVLALVRTLSRINANAFSLHCLDFICNYNFEDIISAISTPPFVWSYKIYYIGFFFFFFFFWSRVTQTLIESTITFSFPEAFFLTYEAYSILLSSELIPPHDFPTFSFPLGFPSYLFS